MIKRKEFFIEFLRSIACFLVILYHSRYQAYSYSHGGDLSWFDNLCLNVSFVVGRFAVPIFFIISGYLTFPLRHNMFDFLKKRLVRIVFPLLTWLLIYTICFSEGNNIANDFFYIVQAPHLWYLYALIGITVLIPITSGFVCNAKPKEILFYVLIWGLTLIFNGNFFNAFLTIETDHNGLLYTNPITGLLSFYGYFGYILLGYSFKRFNIDVKMSYILLLAACGLIYMQVAWFNIPISNVFAYCSLPNALISSSVFLFFKVKCNNYATNNNIYKSVLKIGELSFGIYLTHWLFLQILENTINTEPWNCIVISIIVFCLSILFTFLLSLIPAKKYIIG